MQSGPAPHTLGPQANLMPTSKVKENGQAMGSQERLERQEVMIPLKWQML